MSTCGLIVMSRSRRLPAANNSSRSRPSSGLAPRICSAASVRGRVFELGLSPVIGRREAILSGIFVRGLAADGLDFRHIFACWPRSFCWHGALSTGPALVICDLYPSGDRVGVTLSRGLGPPFLLCIAAQAPNPGNVMGLTPFPQSVAGKGRGATRKREEFLVVQSYRLLVATGVFSLLATWAHEAHAVGVAAGTSIDNTAQVTYTVGAVNVTATSNTVSVTVAEILDVVVTAADAERSGARRARPSRRCSTASPTPATAPRPSACR